MTFEAALFNYLTNYAALKALIQNRVAPMVRLQEPEWQQGRSVIYEILQDRRYQRFSDDPTATRIILRVTAFGKTSELVKPVATELYNALQGLTGEIGGALSGNISIGSCLHEDAVDDYDDDTQTFMVTQEFGIIYNL